MRSRSISPCTAAKLRDPRPAGRCRPRPAGRRARSFAAVQGEIDRDRILGLMADGIGADHGLTARGGRGQHELDVAASEIGRKPRQTRTTERYPDHRGRKGLAREDGKRPRGRSGAHDLQLMRIIRKTRSATVGASLFLFDRPTHPNQIVSIEFQKVFYENVK